MYPSAAEASAARSPQTQGPQPPACFGVGAIRERRSVGARSSVGDLGAWSVVPSDGCSHLARSRAERVVKLRGSGVRRRGSRGRVLPRLASGNALALALHGVGEVC